MNQGKNHPRWSLPRGRVVLRALASDPTQEYLLYVPHSAPAGARVWVSVHGVSRDPGKHPTMFSATCDECGVVLVAPMFDRDWHRGYQRLGPKGLGTRADLLLDQVLAEVASLSGADATRIHLFGFSAGAQFAHRYAMAHPHRVTRAVVAAAGWYTFPDQQQRFPYGIRPVRSLAGVTFNPEEFLRVPITVLIGTLDTSTENMRNTARTVAQQGATRLERARNWVAAMRAAATSFGVEPRTMLIEVPGIGHSFTRFGERGQLVKLVRRALFDDLAIDPRRNGGGDVPATTSPASVPAIT